MNVLPPLPATTEREKLPLFAVFGQTLVVPASTVLGPGGRIPQAKLDDGREVPIEVRRVEVLAFVPTQSFGAIENAALRWMGPVAEWSEAPGLARSNANTIEFCEIQLPPDAIGHWLWLGKEHIDLTWIPAEKPLDTAISGLPAEARSDPFVRECLRVEGKSPFARWRGSLFGVKPPAPVRMPIPYAPDSAESVTRAEAPSVADLLAAKQSSLWNHALLRLRKADPALCERVLVELTRVVRFDGAGTRYAPAWADATDAQSLLDQLLLNRDDPRGMVFKTSQWLRQRPPACAWVSDDAGLLDAESRLPLPRVGVANLSDSTALGWAGGRAEARSPELVSIPPNAARILALPALTGPAAPDSNMEAQSVDAHIGAWTTALAVFRRSMPARPPGLPIAPTYLDHSLPLWTRSQAVSPVPTGERTQVGAMAARLVREAGPTSVPSGSGWSIYLEVERSTYEHQTIRIWYGPMSRPTHIIQVELPETSRIPESGDAVATVREPGERDSLLPGAQVIPAATHWSLRLPVPNRAVERPGLIRLGVEHIRGNVRSSWPRPIFPWATEPARACVDLTRW
ncbi:MAG: hypothetical protein KF805_06210 [Phycisphaeraceae bacterium]|nr:hypothetical protein [Phycisphaeraceae bacterium]